MYSNVSLIASGYFLYCRMIRWLSPVFCSYSHEDWGHGMQFHYGVFTKFNAKLFLFFTTCSGFMNQFAYLTLLLGRLIHSIYSIESSGKVAHFYIFCPKISSSNSSLWFRTFSVVLHSKMSATIPRVFHFLGQMATATTFNIPSKWQLLLFVIGQNGRRAPLGLGKMVAIAFIFPLIGRHTSRYFAKWLLRCLIFRQNARIAGFSPIWSGNVNTVYTS